MELNSFSCFADRIHEAIPEVEAGVVVTVVPGKGRFPIFFLDLQSCKQSFSVVVCVTINYVNLSCFEFVMHKFVIKLIGL